MKILILVGLGGFLGSVLRLVISDFFQTKHLTSFPYGTLAVNIIGCFVIGLVFGFVEKGQLSIEWRYFLATGLIGGFTTFSAYSIETLNLFRDGNIRLAAVNILLNNVLGILLALGGFAIAKLIR